MGSAFFTTLLATVVVNTHEKASNEQPGKTGESEKTPVRIMPGKPLSYPNPSHINSHNDECFDPIEGTCRIIDESKTSN